MSGTIDGTKWVTFIGNGFDRVSFPSLTNMQIIATGAKSAVTYELLDSLKGNPILSGVTVADTARWGLGADSIDQYLKPSQHGDGAVNYAAKGLLQADSSLAVKYLYVKGGLLLDEKPNFDALFNSETKKVVFSKRTLIKSSEFGSNTTNINDYIALHGIKTLVIDTVFTLTGDWELYHIGSAYSKNRLR